MIENIYHKWEIVYTLGTMDLKQKYQNSKLGMLWSFFKPLLQFLAYFFVFGYTLKIDTSPDYPIRLFFGIILWTCFTDGTSMGLSSYLGKKSLVTKVKIDMKLIPISAYYTAALSFFINFSIFLVIYFFKEPMSWKIFKLHNLFIFIGTFVTFSISIISINIILATLNALFRDVQTIWELIMIYGVFIMPIIYPVQVPEKYMSIYYFANIPAFPLETIRSIFFDSSSNLWMCGEYVISYLSGVLLLFLGALFVNYKFGKKVADYL